MSNTNVARAVTPRRRVRAAAWVVTVAAIAAATHLAESTPEAHAAPPLDACAGVIVVDGEGRVNSANHVIQRKGSSFAALCRFERQSLTTLAAAHGAPYDEAERVKTLSYARNEARGQIWGDLVRVMSTPENERTADEQATYAWLQARVGAVKAAMAQKSKAEYDKWKSDPCEYVPPAPYSYDPGCPEEAAAASIVILFTGPPDPPTYHDFVRFGAVQVLAEFEQPEQARIAEQSARFSSHLASFGEAFAIPAIAASVLLTFAISTAGIGFLFPAAIVTGGTFAAIGGAFAAVLVGAVIAVVRGIQVDAISKIPTQLDQDIAKANTPPALSEMAKDPNDLALIYAAFIESTMPDYPNPSFKPAAPTGPTAASPGLLVSSQGVAPTYTNGFYYRDETGTPKLTWIEGGWFVVNPDDGSPAYYRRELLVDTGDGLASVTLNGDKFQYFDAESKAPHYPCVAPDCHISDVLPIQDPHVTYPKILEIRRFPGEVTITSGPIVTGDLVRGSTVSFSVQASNPAPELGALTYSWLIQRQSAAQPGVVFDEQRFGQNVTFELPADGNYTVVAFANHPIGISADASTSFEVTGAVPQLTVLQRPPSSNPQNLGNIWAEGTSGRLIVRSSEPGTASVDFDRDGAPDAVGPADATEAEFVGSFPDEGSHPVDIHFVGTEGDVIDETFAVEVRNMAPTRPEVQIEVGGTWRYLADPSDVVNLLEGDTVEMRFQVYDQGPQDEIQTIISWPDGGIEIVDDTEPGTWHYRERVVFDYQAGLPGVEVRATDDFGATGPVGVAHFGVSNVLPTLEDVSVSVDVDGRATLTGKYFDTIPEVRYAEIDWGDGSLLEGHVLPMAIYPDHEPTTEPGTGPPPLPPSPDEILARHTFAHSGTYSATLTVYDSSLTWTSVPVEIVVGNRRPKIVGFDALDVKPNLLVNLAVDLTDPDHGDAPSTLVLEVDWGDGHVTSTAWDPITGNFPVDHVYDAPGQYVVKVRALDDEGVPSKVVEGTLDVVDLGPVLIADPSSLDLGVTRVGTSSVATTITVTNEGTHPADVGALAVSGADADLFSAVADMCTDATLAVGATCTVDVAFSPDAIGSASASLLVPYDGRGGPLAISLSGDGAVIEAPVITLGVGFGDVTIGDRSTQTATVANDGVLPVAIGAVTLSPAVTSSAVVGVVELAAVAVAGFAVDADACGGQVLDPGEDCEIVVSFTATTPGTFSVRLSIGSDPEASAVLSAVAIAAPSTTPTTTPAGPPGESPTPPGDAGATGSTVPADPVGTIPQWTETGDLPATGSNSTDLVPFALVLLGVGLALLHVRTRRR